MDRFTQVTADMRRQIAESNGGLTEQDLEEALDEIRKDPFGYFHADGASPNAALINDLQKQVDAISQERFTVRMRAEFNDDYNAVLEDIDLLEKSLLLERQVVDVKLGELASMREAARVHIAELPAPDPAKVNAPTPSSPMEAMVAKLVGPEAYTSAHEGLEEIAAEDFEEVVF